MAQKFTDIAVTGSLNDSDKILYGQSDADRTALLSTLVSYLEGQDFNFTGQVTIAGNLDVNGTSTSIDTDSLAIEDNTIVLNKNQTGSPSPVLTSGVEIERGDDTNYKFIFQESDDTFRVGEAGSEQAVATREDTPVDGALAVWNDAEKRFNTTETPTVNTLSVSVDNLTVATRRVATVSTGSSFHSSPGLGDECYRSDLDEWYKYNGAIWMQI